MKKIILKLIIIVFTKNLEAQTVSVTDTLSYLQTIVANKSQFIGQPFTVLKDSLKIQIKFFSPFAGIHYDKSKETSTDFGFHVSQSIDDYNLTYPRLEIVWQPPLNANQSDIIWESNGKGAWLSNAVVFYNTGIIADIKVRE